MTRGVERQPLHGQSERAWRLVRGVTGLFRTHRPAGRPTRTDIAWLIDQMMMLAVPDFCEWCAVDTFEADGHSQRFGFRHVSCLNDPEQHHERCEVPPVHENEAQRERILRAASTRSTQEVVSSSDGTVSGVVVPLLVNGEPWGTLTFANDAPTTDLGDVAVEAAEQVAGNLVDLLERSQLMDANRDAVRQTQRIARQLHQLIAASITVTGMRTDIEILRNLAASARSVFDADAAIVSLQEGSSAPLTGVARRGRVATCDFPSAELVEETPKLRIGEFEPWLDGDWLVAPILVNRIRSRGVIAIRRFAQQGFSPEDREVLTLLAQMAEGAVAASELGRTIEASEERLRILFETAPIGIVEVDPQGGVRFWNHAASRILAWGEYPQPEDGDGPRFPTSMLGELSDLWSEAASGRFVSGRDLAVTDAAQRVRILNVSAAPLPTSDGSAAGMLTLVDDVTNQRELRAEVRHAQSMEVRGQVASRIAHDFNNLLTLISGYAEILSRELHFDERTSQMAREIQATASRASLLTGQLQTIGRTMIGKPVVFDPVAAIQSNAEVLERILGEEIQLVWNLAEHVENVRADPDQFEQMVLNLSINARDAMPEGGELRISVADVDLTFEQASELVIAPGGYVRVIIEDTGSGMDEETVAQCFEPLFTTKGPLKGTGMGLASARRFVEESGGAITCQSVIGQGTRFQMLFPSINESASEISTRIEAPKGDGNSVILIAEDDSGLRRLMSTVIQRNGFRVIEADSGETALALAADPDVRIDLLLSDVIMGGITGRDLAGQLQSARPELRVLLVSGTEGAESVEGLLPGSGSFLAKPFKPSELIDQVHDVLSRTRSPIDSGG